MEFLKTAAVVSVAVVAGFVGTAGALVAVLVMAIRVEDRLQERNADVSKRVEL